MKRFSKVLRLGKVKISHFFLITHLVLIASLLFITYELNKFIISQEMEKLSFQTSQAIAEQIVYDLKNFSMSDDKLKDYLSQLKDRFKRRGLKIRLIQNKIVYKKEKIGNKIILAYPIQMKNFSGSIEIEQDISYYIKEINKKITLAALFSLFPGLIVFLLSELSDKELTKSIKSISRKIENINSLDDLSKLEKELLELPFEEFVKIQENINKLIDRIKKIAVDKNILEFETKILEKFMLTSDSINDWRSFLRDILQQLNEIIDYTYFFSIFKEGESKFTATIFWNCKNYKDFTHLVENYIIKVLKEKGLYDENFSIDFEHIPVEKEKNCSNFKELLESKEIINIAKALIVDQPLVGGVVGLGVHISETENSTKALAIESILSILLNYVGSIKAISKYTKELEYYATRDPLTGLYNQRLFWELLNYEVNRARRYNYPFSVLVIDLDNFKVVNDTYGHHFGDEFLVEIARIIQNTLRKGDVIARYGGDEFAVILPLADVEQALSIATRILENLNKFSMQAPDGKKIKATASIGIATFPYHGKTAKELFTVADSMMYKAKEEGKGKVAVPSQEDIAELLQSAADKSFIILDAVENKKVIPYYQPIKNLKTGKIEAFEVLMRIEHEGKILTADKFIETAENLGLVYKLDLILLEKVMETIVQKFKDKFKCKLFFNLSPKSLIISDFIQKIDSIIDSNINPNQVVFEITERETVRNIKLLEKFTLNLKEKGYQFAIDDFGAGFASFQYVKFLPIDYVKIDGEFIRSLPSSRMDKAFVMSLITLAKALNIKTIAEFIENEEIEQTVKELGVDYGQGFYIGKPTSDISNFLE